MLNRRSLLLSTVTVSVAAVTGPVGSCGVPHRDAQGVLAAYLEPRGPSDRETLN